MKLLLCCWISGLCILLLLDPLCSHLVVLDKDVFTSVCIPCRHSYVFVLTYLTDNHFVLWYVSEKGTTWWWKNWNYADWSCYNKEVWVALGICHYLLSEDAPLYNCIHSDLGSPTYVTFQSTCHILVMLLLLFFSTKNTIFQYFDICLISLFVRGTSCFTDPL